MIRSPALLPVALVLLGGAGCDPRRGDGSSGEVSSDAVSFLSSSEGTEGFARAEAGRPIVFPEDHGPHPEYQTEWWYFTGNLSERLSGRRFGFQLTFFRRALAPPVEVEPRSSAWAASEVYLAHLAVTDVRAGTFHSAERLSRGAAGLAGARAEPFLVWVDSWRAEGAGESTTPMRLEAQDGAVSLSLLLDPHKPLVFHGEEGYSRKGPEPGDASYYYSWTRLGASGSLTTEAGSFEVEGLAWMDHEWSTSALSRDQVGWDWVSLQLDGGTELMAFQIREREGGLSAESSGSLVDRSGEVTALGREDFTLTPTGRWRSPRSGGLYPSGWRLDVPGAALVLTLDPLLDDQEHGGAFRYWEGAVSATGTAAGASVSGYGYVELTGYAPIDGTRRPPGR